MVFRVLLASCYCVFSLWYLLITSFLIFLFAEKPNAFDSEKWWRSQSVTQHTKRITTTTKLCLTHMFAETRACNHIHFWQRAAGVVQIHIWDWSDWPVRDHSTSCLNKRLQLSMIDQPLLKPANSHVITPFSFFANTFLLLSLFQPSLNTLL